MWSYKADSRMTSTPAIAGGLVYAGTWNGDVLALDARSGKLIWKAHLGANSDEVYGGFRGVIGTIAVQNGVAYAASGNCTLAAYRATSGERLWLTKICDNTRNDDVYASPVVVDGFVLIGTDVLVDRPTSRGREIALDARTGKIRWAIELARYQGTGTGISATPAVEPASRIVYLGTGNPTPTRNPPPGPDPGSESIVALNLANGSLRWSYGPVHPHDTNDNDFFASPNRFAVTVAGRRRWVIGEGNKDGTYYTVDAQSGNFLWRRTLGTESSATLIGTSAVASGTIYVPLYDGNSGSLTALRTSDGTVLWQASTGGEYEAPVVWGPAVFTTESTGWLDEFAAGTGKLLSRRQLCGRAMGRGPSVSGNGIYVAAGNCLSYFAETE
jgi:polyvinyl alcohol dehydrogenase (cytochrome)